MVLTRVLDSVSSRLAFFPPSPPSYSLARHGDGAGELYVKPQNEGARAIPGAKVHRLPTGKGGVGGDVIVAAYIPSPGPPTRFTVLHSHGNAVDLGQMLPVYSHLARLLKVNVMGYDYRGYGQSEGEPAASNTLRDISVVLDCLCQEYQRQLSDVVIMGQSVGTGPTSWLAARTPGLAGVVLHSAYLSGLRVLKPGLTWWPAALDIYPNFKHVPKIECKTLIMHVSACCYSLVWRQALSCWCSFE